MKGFKNWPQKLTAGILIVAPVIFFAPAVKAQTNQPKTVAVFLYQGVELLDFAGPGEVFSASGFKTFTMSVDGKELRSQGFVTIKPEYSIETAPLPDIIVFPGGSSGPTSKDPRVIDWIKKTRGVGSVFMSVCTGAFILAQAGLLDDKNVTTHWGATESLSKKFPKSTVLENTRFVDNGDIITTAGVSAGIDGALHLVSRIKGLDAAKSAAHYMEYDKWDPTQGQVDRENEIIEKLRKESPRMEKEMGYVPDLGSNKVIPYEGEFLNLSSELRSKNQLRQAAAVLEIAIKFYPDSQPSYALLYSLYRKLGKPAPLEEGAFIKLIADKKIEEAVAIYEKEQKAFPGGKTFSEIDLNTAGYQLLAQKDYLNAIKVFQLNAKAYPKSFNVFDSLGEAYLSAGNEKEAIANYRKSLELNSENTNAIDVLAKVESGKK